MSDLNSLDTPNDEQTEVVDQSTSYSDFRMVEDTHDSQPDIVDQEVEEAEEVAEEPKPQTKADNHAAKAARLKAERAARAEIDRAKESARSEMDEQIRNSGAINPYTNKPFENMNEFLEYGKKVKEADQKQRAEDEGKSVEDIIQEDNDKEYIRKKRQEDSANEKAQKEKSERDEFIREDLNQFKERYPDVDMDSLITNQNFVRFVGSRFGSEPIADLYADFVDLIGEAEKNGRLKETRGNRSTGSGSDGGSRLSAAQQRDLEAWNRHFPDMKMTPKEFLQRSNK